MRLIAYSGREGQPKGVKETLALQDGRPRRNDPRCARLQHRAARTVLPSLLPFVPARDSLTGDRRYHSSTGVRLPTRD
jgi:hypothetical protein